MGCFDFQCSNSNCEEWEGGQNDHEDYTVYIEVSLKNDKTIFLRGSYDSYGTVEVGGKTFKPIQFQDFDSKGVPRFIGNHYLCTNIWCSNCFNYYNKLSKEISLDDLMTTSEYSKKMRNKCVKEENQ